MGLIENLTSTPDASYASDEEDWDRQPLIKRDGRQLHPEPEIFVFLNMVV